MRNEHIRDGINAVIAADVEGYNALTSAEIRSQEKLAGMICELIANNPIVHAAILRLVVDGVCAVYVDDEGKFNRGYMTHMRVPGV